MPKFTASLSFSYPPILLTSYSPPITMEPPAAHTPDTPAEEQQPASEGSLIQRQGAWLQARLQPVVQVAAAIAGKVRFQAIVSGIAGVWVWGVLFYPFAFFERVWFLVLGVVMLGLLLMPATVLLLFWAGLRELISVPDKLVAAAGEGEVQSGALLEAVADKKERWKARRLWRFFRIVLNLRSLILDSKGLLLQFALVARVANPVFIAVLFVSFVLSLLLILAAVIAVLVVVF